MLETQKVRSKDGTTLKIFTASLCYLQYSFRKKKKQKTKKTSKSSRGLKIERGYAKNTLTAVLPVLAGRE